MTDYKKIYDHLNKRSIGLKDRIWTRQCEGFIQHNFNGTFTEWKNANGNRGFNRAEFNGEMNKRGLMMVYAGDGVFKEYVEEG